MNNHSLEALVIFCVWFACTLIAGWLASFAFRLLRRRVESLLPESRNALQMQFAILPPVLAGLVTLCLFQPAFAFTFVPAHCHGSNCNPHLPMVGITSLGGVVLTGVGMLALILGVGLLISSIRRSSRQQRLIERLSRIEGSYHIVESDQLQAWCFGLWRPKAYLSSAVVDTLPEDQLRVVLAHEHCHALRRDNLRRLIVATATLLWPRSSRRKLLGDFMLSAEQVCDLNAAALLGDDKLVRATLARMGSGESLQLPLRLQALGGAPETTSFKGAWMWIAGLWCGQFLLLIVSAHRALEWLLPVV